MVRANTTDRLRRLQRLAVLLKQGDPCTIADLARETGVSPRTIARDLELMRDQGMQIETERGRGGGLRLDRNWGVGRLNLSYEDAVDLLISIAVAEQMKSPMFLANLDTVRRQLVASFSPAKRDRVERLKSRILIGVTASTQVQSGTTAPPRRVIQSLHKAFVDRDCLEIRYQREDGKVSNRVIEPHYLLLKYPVWYVIAQDRLREAPRTFRADRMLSATPQGDPFRLLPKSVFRPSLVNDGLLA